METKHKCRALNVIVCFIVLFNRGWISAIKPPDQIENDSGSCEAVVQEGKEVPQKATYRVDGKRSYGKPGDEFHHFVQWKHCETDMQRRPTMFPGQPHDCADIQASGVNVSGIYGIYIGRPLNVFCDMKTNGGGWTVIQRRMDGSVDFSRSWLEYKKGFGSVSSEHWLGNENIHHLSTKRIYDLRVDLEAFTGQTRYASYNLFNLGNETEKYKLTLGGLFRGTAGDGLSFHKGSRFSTQDQDNDDIIGNWAEIVHSGWWFKNYYDKSDLNGLYLTGNHSKYTYLGVIWKAWLGYPYSMKTTEMKIRPVINDQ